MSSLGMFVHATTLPYKLINKKYNVERRKETNKKNYLQY